MRLTASVIIKMSNSELLVLYERKLNNKNIDQIMKEVQHAKCLLVLRGVTQEILVLTSIIAFKPFLLPPHAV